jgi:hypothetical protein
MRNRLPSLCLPLLLAQTARSQACPPNTACGPDTSCDAQPCGPGLAPMPAYTIVNYAYLAPGATRVVVPVPKHYSPTGHAPSLAELSLIVHVSGVLDIHNLDANAPALVTSIWGAQGSLASPSIITAPIRFHAARTFADNLAPNQNQPCTFTGPDAVHHVDPPFDLLISARSTVEVCLTDPVLLRSLFTSTSPLETLPFTFTLSSVTNVSGGTSLCTNVLTEIRAEVQVRYSGCEPATADNSGSVFCECTSLPPPCTNVGANGNGCASSVDPRGVELRGLGSVAPDAVVLRVLNLPSNALCVLFQSRAAQPQRPPPMLGSGQRCLDGAPLRLFVRNASNGQLLLPAAGDPSISARSAALGDPFLAGATRHYQIIYRDPLPGGCPGAASADVNSSNGYRIVWY